jgi:hypothetical protein
MEFFFLVLGHLWGDYMLQTEYMAMEKTNDCVICWIHCLIYTTVVILFTQIFHPLFLLAVFISHFLIDWFSLGEKWLKLIKGRDFTKTNKGSIYVSFSTLVYAVVDNTMHLTIMAIALILLEGK